MDTSTSTTSPLAGIVTRHEVIMLTARLAEIEAEHDRIEAEQTALKSKFDALLEKLSSSLASIQEFDRQTYKMIENLDGALATMVTGKQARSNGSNA